jgi:hypothetical protein
MGTDLGPIKAALAEVTDTELRALTAAANGVPQIAPGLLAWIEYACDWEVNRRRGLDFRLQPPEAAIDPSEDAVSIDAAIAMRATFGQDAPAVRGFFDSLLELLTGGGGISRASLESRQRGMTDFGQLQPRTGQRNHAGSGPVTATKPPFG